MRTNGLGCNTINKTTRGVPRTQTKFPFSCKPVRRCAPFNLKRTTKTMSFIGHKIEVLDEGGSIAKEITIRKEREIGGVLYVTDEDGDIYSEDELNLTYRLTQERIMWNALVEAGIHDESTAYDYEAMHKAVEAFMEGMEKAGYVERRSEE